MFTALKSGLTTRLSGFGISTKLHKVVSNNNVNKYQVATLLRAAYRDEDEIPLFKPFPYHEKEYGWLAMIMDTSKTKLHKHAKIIVVDGPVCCGKNKFGQELAKELDFLFLPEPSFDELYITHWGFDARTLDSQLPKEAQSWDIDRFLQDPHDINTAAMQLYMYYLRLKTYLHALVHISHTGQGVVTIRSPWSDRCFATAMHASKYISDGAYETILNSYKASWHYFLRPHLVIYFDVPVEVTLENIKKNGEPLEKTSKVFTKKYITDLETDMREQMLNYLQTHCLIYCHKEFDEPISDVLDEIEKLNFDDYKPRHSLLNIWRMYRRQHIGYTRVYSAHYNHILSSIDIHSLVPELHMSGESSRIWHEVWAKVDDGKFDPGYNYLKGDTNWLWKTKQVWYKDYVTPLIEKYKERYGRELKKLSSK